ncbi:hypothetical protein M569_15268 [Genlisea aurea]|uniref:Uncharacterized protein n=1 Tax=Genlisea aurea TaxID=192259 RepID=S8DJ70_9LAMI|nr:hypothetical protein M569_15268 [Genlisea aurea]
MSNFQMMDMMLGARPLFSRSLAKDNTWFGTVSKRVMPMPKRRRRLQRTISDLAPHFSGIQTLAHFYGTISDLALLGSLVLYELPQVCYGKSLVKGLRILYLNLSVSKCDPEC